MKTATKTLIAAALSLAGLSAFADPGDYIGSNAALDAQIPAKVSANTREQVQAELAAALAAGRVDRFDPAGVKDPKFNWTTMMARETASPAPLLAQVRDHAERLQSAGGLTREEVRAEVLAAQRAGELDPSVNADVKNALPTVHYTAAPRNLAQSR